MNGGCARWWVTGDDFPKGEPFLFYHHKQCRGTLLPRGINRQVRDTRDLAGLSAVLQAFPSCPRDGCPAQCVTSPCGNVQRQAAASLCAIERRRKCFGEATSSLPGQRTSRASTHHGPRGEDCVQPMRSSTPCPPRSWGGTRGPPGHLFPERSPDAVSRKEVGRK